MRTQLDRSSTARQASVASSPRVKPKQHFMFSILSLVLSIFFVALTVTGLTGVPAGAQARGSISPAQNILQNQTHALAAIRTVTNTNDNGIGSLRAALIAANAGDTIQFSLAANSVITVASELAVTKFITINGSTATNLSVSGNNATRVFSVTAPAAFISFTIMNGSAAGNGGGLYSTSALTLTAMQFLNNQCTYPCNGGGLYTISTLVLSGTEFFSNTADYGGGVYASAAATLTGGLFQNNNGGYGGGALISGTATLNGGVFQNNTADYGGGLYTGPNSVSLSGTQFLSNTATNRKGGGAYAGGPATLNGGLFQNNFSDFSGGGLYAYSTLALTDTRFFSNTSHTGGGAYVSGTETLYGGVFQNNSAVGYGGGLYAHSPLVLSITQFLSNTAKIGGGGASADSAATLNGGLFQNNRALCCGGGLYVFSTFALTGTRFISNMAQDGGGLYREVYADNQTGRIVNTLFARNVATTTDGAAMYLFTLGNGSVQILHTTIASPTLGSGSAIYIQTGTVGITDTIISNYSIGISRTAGSVYENYNLFFGTTTSKSGSFVAGSGANDVGGNPKFVDPGVDNYHLAVGSAAIDAGTNVSVTTDIDGQTRPFNGLFDIGYDEVLIYKIYLPLALKNF